jgi:hypothetical protein
MTRYEQEYYADVKQQTKLLKRIAVALEELVKKPFEYTNQPGQAGDNFDVDMRNRNNEFLDHSEPELDSSGFDSNEINHYQEKLNQIEKQTDEPELDSSGFDSNEISHYQEKLKQTDYDLRKHIIERFKSDELKTKKDAIIEYVKKKGKAGARYTEVIRMAFEISHGVGSFKPTQNRGYYSCAFAPRFGGHLVQGGKDYLTKPFNKTYYSNEYVSKVGIGVIEDYLDGDVNP